MKQVQITRIGQTQRQCTPADAKEVEDRLKLEGVSSAWFLIGDLLGSDALRQAESEAPSDRASAMVLSSAARNVIEHMAQRARELLRRLELRRTLRLLEGGGVPRKRPRRRRPLRLIKGGKA